ncbi:MAG: hypothetical protein JNL10_06360 [Verrucomicrobiales bacterium]|nr:hypothetical protein [Verrucomicrobiales bacterium]
MAAPPVVLGILHQTGPDGVRSMYAAIVASVSPAPSTGTLLKSSSHGVPWRLWWRLYHGVKRCSRRCMKPLTSLMVVQRRAMNWRSPSRSWAWRNLSIR